ncbi:acyl-CoA dehydrogenase family protein [Crocinitomicaceae bacterium]|jgi:alkylation response protein AidB-like acyl-CoA dehydrogenase|nr:acyl-CoA dehydrogenase [Flavobacteriales bacterium]MDA8910195.1 acyl-CoA dehydrogenase family protein [Crocinitomicaceae bacterium]MDC0302185.1 acyl-CoA dehydrogenase family protein [bacterium]MBT5932802.1 acyl-CoA dehydrogenase [Flavobacteriales bacterium]MDC0272271.1 acyl-CoA dehydrogenase family protein [Crocinitomicaceae bacterium]
MNFELNENQQMISQMVRDFSEKEIRPNLNKWDSEEFFPVDTMKKMGELGLLGIFVPEEYGGSGFTYFEYATALMELGKVCGGVGLSVAAHNSLCTGHILYHGNEAQKKKYLPKLASGEWIGAWGLTEANTGSDAMRMETTAVEDGDFWVLNGTKNWITHGLSGDVAVVLIRTGDLLDSKGITAFIVEKGTPGFSAVKIKDKLGVRASETAELIFDNVRIPKENVIGNVGDGFKQAMKVLDGGRISIASLSCGVARGAYEASVQYAKEREQFGKPIGQFQAIAFKLADMATEIEAAELLTFQAAYLKNNKKPVTKEGAYAKYFASEVSVRCGNEAVQIMGGYGYTKEYPAEKFLRDSKLMTIGEGTSEIQKIVISREILK